MAGLPRGTCRVCGQEHPLNRGGELYVHRDPRTLAKSPEASHRDKRTTCPGSAKKPVSRRES